LTRRTATGHLLEGDRRDYLSAFALVRRHLAQAQALQQRALEYANAHVLSGILLAFSFVVLLTLYTLNPARKRV
jgi:hypothetical protein